jgi:hypothetical protein
MRGLLYMRELFNPFTYGFVSYQLISHKLLRWLVPVFMIGIFTANLFLIGHPFYNVTLLLQLAFYGMAVAGWVGEKLNVKPRLLSIPLYFSTVNLAAMLSLYRVWRGYKAVTWETVRK